MNLKSLAIRLLFYGLIVTIGISVFKLTHLTTSGETGSKIFGVISVISGLIQSINLVVLNKITEIQKIDNLSFWVRWRLSTRIESRRITAFLRSIIGVGTSIIIGISAAWMNTQGTNNVAYWVLGSTSAIAVISVILIYLTIYEFYIISKLETDIKKYSDSSNRKKQALESIRNSEKDS